jgi:hypothetical protein
MRHTFESRLALPIAPLAIAVVESALVGPLVPLPSGPSRSPAAGVAALRRTVRLAAITATAEKKELPAAPQPAHHKAKRIQFLATISAKNWTRTSPRAISPMIGAVISPFGSAWMRVQPALPFCGASRIAGRRSGPKNGSAGQVSRNLRF